MRKYFFLAIFFILISVIIFSAEWNLSHFEIIQTLGESYSVDVELGYFNEDTYIDAFVPNHYDQPDQIWLGNGDGTFREGQSLIGTRSYRVALGYIDGDSYIDAFVVNYFPVNKVWLGNGDGTFRDSGELFGGNSISYGVALGKIDDDDHIDAFVANHNYEEDQIWLGNGDGTFRAGQSLSGSFSVDVELADLNGDDYLDAFVTCPYSPNRVWINKGDGTGTFKTDVITVRSSYTLGVDLGDLNGDGKIDAVLANSGPNEVWLGNGDGTFTEGLSFGSSLSHDVELIDLDGDTIIDAVFVANRANQPNKLWKNDGSGNFIDSELSFGNSTSYGAALSDFNGDDLLDIFVANGGTDIEFQPNIVWLNRSIKIVKIDIIPGSFLNTINLRSKGNIPVAIFSLNDFDATTVDPSTVTLAGASIKTKKNGKPMVSFEDVDGDGLEDIVVHVITAELKLTVDDVEAVLKGKTTGGIPIRGVDSVRVIE